MSATQDYVALEWIRGELANTLQNAQVALEAVAESADDASSMRTCLTAIHQVHGTLKMVQLEGPTQMAAEMEQVAQSLMNNSVSEVRLAQETLMQAILQLPAYLDRLHREQEDSERNYLPMVNNLRAVRGEERIQGSGAELEEGEGPDLGPLTKAASDEVVNAYYQGDGEGNLPKIRTRYQQCLGAILKKTKVRENLTTIGKLLTMLIRLCGNSPTGNLAELGLGVIEGVANGGIKLDNQTATRLKQIDDHLKPLAAAGQDGLSTPVAEELAIGLIKLINESQKETKRISALRQRYASEAPEPEEVAIGPDDETMSAVASILIEELNSVTDRLDLFVRAQNRNIDDLTALVPNLEQISSTMVILDNAEQQTIVANQISIIKGLETSGQPSDDVLLNMAQALLEIGVGLGQLVMGSEEGGEGDSFANLDEAQAAVVRETRIGLAAAKDSVIDFISSEFDHAKIEELPQTLKALRGGLMIVNQLQAGDVLEAAANYVANALLNGNQTPELEQMDDLADAITSVDYYLERLLENASDPYLQMLEVAETAVEKLGYAVGAEAPAPVVEDEAAVVEDEAAAVVEDEVPVAEDLVEEVVEEVEDSIEELVEDSTEEQVEDSIEELVEDSTEEQVEDSIEELVEDSTEEQVEDSIEELVEDSIEEQVEDSIEEQVEDSTEELVEDSLPEPIEEPVEEPVEVAEPVLEPEIDDDLIDDEIIEIFVDEAEEVLETILEFLPIWKSEPVNGEALTEIRRAFHTLKGSGRMVGATVVGELAWSIESLLNCVIEKKVAATQAVMDIITEVVEQIPEGVTAFKEGQQNRFKPEGLAAIADALAEGGEVPALPATVSSEVEAVEESFELDEIIDTADIDSLELVEEDSPELVEEDSPELVEEDSLELVEEDSPELVEEDSLELVEEDSPELVEEDSFELVEEDSPELVEEDSLELVEEDSPELVEEDSFELVEEDSPELVEEDSLELVEEDSLELVEEDSPELVEEVLELEEVVLELEEDTAASGVEDAPSLDLEELDIDDDAFELDIVEEIEVTETESVSPELDEIDLDDIEEEVEVVVEEPATPDVDIETIVEATAPIAETTADALIEDDDLELEEIFTIEAEEKLEVIDGFVANPGEFSSDLVAAFHTLKGSAAMAEISSISVVATPLEHLTNEYLVQNKPADQHLVDAVQEAASLIRAVLQDIPGNRDSVSGSDALLGRLAGTAIEVEPEIGFDFREIQLLSEANIAADGWQDVEALVSELKVAQEQATNLNQPDLAALITSMLRIYSEAPSKPDDLTLSLMRRAHDHLVFMFDALASSQPLRAAGGVIAELDAIDLNPVEVEAAPEILVEPEVEVAPAQTSPAEVASEELTQLPADDIDEDILSIFLEEAEELQEEIDQSILGWSESGSPGDNLDNLLRQLHTIKGGARMAGAASLGEYAHNFETFLIGVQSKPVDFDESFFALLNSQQDEITRRVEIYQKLATGSASPEELESLKTAVSLESGNGSPSAAVVAPVEQTLVDTPVVETPVVETPAAASGGGDAVVELPADEVDEDILPIFLEESDDLVEELESSIQAWSESPGSMGTLDVLLRNLHTLKGGARMAGLNSLGEYAHNFETFLIGIQKNPIELDDEFFALLNKRQDEVIRRVEIYKKLSFGAASEEDLASLKSALEPTLETDSVEAPDTTIDDSASAEPKAATNSASGEASQDKNAASSNQEMVRVSADLLEELIGLAGESSITRGRVEQQITDFGEYLQEMEETINRVRDQVRRLEIEAESRETLIRSREGADGDSGFDDLEMDRYTMLQAISRALSEGSSDMMDLKDTLGNRSRDAETLLHQQARISAELQEGLTRTRMVPFARLIPRLRRIVRQISGEVGKSVRFDAYNVEGELDRNVLERIVAPLEHMLRNAVDHGIEDKEARVASGKQEQGRISLRLSREGGYVVLTISDDGGGIDVNAVRGKAIERGLITEGQDVSDHEVMQFIMHAGFSTAQKLTQISGRGVGMDVVGSEIKALGGSMAIDSTLGVGTEFTIRIPFTVSINRALMVVVKEETYAVPLNTIEGIVRVSPYELEAYYQPDAPMFEYAGQPYRLAYIGKMLDNADDPNLAGQVAPLPVILARSGDHAVALQVDKVIGSREVVVKTLGPQFSDVGGISGATVLGDGSVVIILDCMALVRSYEAGVDVAAAPVIEESVPESDNKVRTVMIVDDSVTVRKVTTRLMERQGFKVATAKDGVDAMNQLQDIRPDVVLLDIEMPRMDGFEVLRSVRRDENLKDLPIIMITSRTGEKHKQQAMELGVNQYLGKPFQEANLLATIEEVIESAKSKPEQD